jgi:isopentenyl phosphate kinase
METRLRFLKLGGSLLTDKARPRSLRRGVLRSVACAVGRALRAGRFRLLVGHGGGSFGHSIADAFRVVEGLRAGRGWRGFHETREAMLELDAEVVRALRRAGVEAVPVQPSSACSARDGVLERFDAAAIRAILAAGGVPVVFGDAVPDSVRGFTILSTEALFAALAPLFKPCAVLELADVPGILRMPEGLREGAPGTRDPKGRGGEGEKGREADGATGRRATRAGRGAPDGEAQVVRVFTRKDLESFRASAGRGRDVTGGITSKARFLVELARTLPRAEVRLLSGLDPAAVEAALLGRFTGGTRFEDRRIRRFRD